MLIEDIQQLEQSALKESMLEDTKVIKDGIERVAKIIESMREVSQKNSEKKEIVNILETVVSSLIISHNRAKQVTKIELNGKTFDFNYTTEEKFFAFVQKQRLEQVWIIIINNALDELVKIENFEDRVLHISVKALKHKVIVQFKDNAGGINEKILPHIFEPFESTKESSGIGIGLNIAKRIVDEQDGKIKAYNQDNGAVFEITLPLKEFDDASK
jgi:C4-dicarboxylate-specific signal transduction histidine kinase